MLAFDQPRPTAVAVDPTHVYWLNADDHTIMRVPISGGSVESAAKDVFSQNFAIDADAIYYVGGTNGPLQRVGKEQRDLTTIATTGDPAEGFVAVDSSNVFWATGSVEGNLYFEGNVWMTPKAGLPDGGAGAPIARMLGLTGLAVDDDNVYVTRFDGKVLYTPKAAPQPLSEGVLVASGQRKPGPVALTKDHLFWANRDTGSIKRVPRSTIADAGAPEQFASGNPAEAIAVDAVAVYFTTSTSNAVLSCPISGCTGEPRVVARDQARPTGVAVDARAVYWSNAASGTIMKVAK
jgi:hypothetical protein